MTAEFDDEKTAKMRAAALQVLIEHDVTREEESTLVEWFLHEDPRIQRVTLAQRLLALRAARAACARSAAVAEVFEGAEAYAIQVLLRELNVTKDEILAALDRMKTHGGAFVDNVLAVRKEGGSDDAKT